MTDNNILKNARYIFTTGKLIHDRILSAQTEHLSKKEGDGCFEDLSMAQCHVMMTVRRREPVSMTELAGALGVSPPSASVMVERLVDKGTLLREQDPRDRRKVVVKVRPEVMAHIAEIEENILEIFIDLVEKIGPETAQKWCEVLGEVKAVLEKAQSDHS